MAMATTTGQLLLRGLDGRTSCLRFPSTIVTGTLIQDKIATHLRLPVEALLIVTGTTVVHPHSSLCASSDGFFPSCILTARLRGGKGGFGSLLRGAATKAGQKKTSNFDACRDMSGRRLRHVNAEKKLKEWKAQAKERDLEKAANEFLKKQVKQKERDSGCSQVIEQFREETSRAREEVESAVASGLAEAKRFGKRKVMDNGPLPITNSKRANIWLNSNVDMSEDDLEDEAGNSDDDDDAAAAERVSEVEDSKVGSVDVEAEEAFQSPKVNGNASSCSGSSRHGDAELDKSDGQHELGEKTVVDFSANGQSDSSNVCRQTQEILNLDGFSHASDLEVLGLDRLKHELQMRGLKCGGGLAQRAGRLFLLKTIPLDKLDKKHFAKARG